VTFAALWDEALLLDAIADARDPRFEIFLHTAS